MHLKVAQNWRHDQRHPDIPGSSQVPCWWYTILTSLGLAFSCSVDVNFIWSHGFHPRFHAISGFIRRDFMHIWSAWKTENQVFFFAAFRTKDTRSADARGLTHWRFRRPKTSSPTCQMPLAVASQVTPRKESQLLGASHHSFKYRVTCYSRGLYHCLPQIGLLSSMLSFSGCKLSSEKRKHSAPKLCGELPWGTPSPRRLLSRRASLLRRVSAFACHSGNLPVRSKLW